MNLNWLRRYARTAPDPRLLDPLPSGPHPAGAEHLASGGKR
ncbi:hypothetical protein [Streptomyces sp. CB01201]|nr:hypothetical protein [Streptomyces sp. CB01201]